MPKLTPGRVAALALVVAGGVAALVFRNTRRSGPASSAHVAPQPALEAEGTAPASRRDAAPAPTAAPTGSAAPAATSSPRTRLRARWGDGPDAVGRKREEGAPEAPMSLVAGAAGETWLLDQVNRRVQRYGADGRLERSVALAGDTAQDLALGPDGQLYVLDRLGHGDIAVFGPDGTALGRVPVVGGPIGEGGAVTGIFADAGGLYLEREHTDVVRVAGPDGAPDPDRPTLLGRPTRDGAWLLQASLQGRGSPVATLRVLGRDGSPRWQQAVTFPHAILFLVLLDSDRRGHVYLGAHVGDEVAGPARTLAGESVIVARFAQAGGAPQGVLVLPAYTGPEEMFRELSVADDGELAQLLPSDDGLTVASYRFP